MQLIVSDEAVKGVRSNGAKGDLSPDEALLRLLPTRVSPCSIASGAIAIVRDEQSDEAPPTRHGRRHRARAGARCWKP